tara:strand:- start:68 stop:289 length:222 start_codon:yes stop_codon:yes gene_type:complete
MAKRLTEKHPLTEKYRKFEDFMIENKISVEWNGYRMVFMDNVTGETAYIRDAESSEECNDLPWMCETKLVRED